MRVCDFVSDFIYKSGVKDVFMVSGGGVMFLTDGLACNKDLRKICCHHEQAAAFAAVGYAKYSGLGCAYFTTGCGGSNAVTGVLNAWQDNIPCIFISGQCKRRETTRYKKTPTRQIGVQEADIVEIVSSITKYAAMVCDENEIQYHLQKALYLAKSGRPGPVWIDIPMDIQAARIDPSKLKSFSPEELPREKTEIAPEEIALLDKLLKNSERPIIIAGGGIRLAGAADAFNKFASAKGIPFVASRMGLDVSPTNNPLYVGRIGNKGNRAANFALQNADLVIALGSRLSVSSTGQQYEYFARAATVVAVDIDKFEHTKNTVHVEHVINADLRGAIDALSKISAPDYSPWAKFCAELKNKFPVCPPDAFDSDSDGVSMYAFMDRLSAHLKPDSAIVSDTGSALFVSAQAVGTTDARQRYITTGAQAEMGYALPAAIGVSAARGFGETLALCGDGSLQMNIQEFQTLVYNKVPVKLFVWNNDGYLSIRATQRKFFGGRFIGTDDTSGVSFPDLSKVAAAYGIKYVRIDSLSSIDARLEEAMSAQEPVICELMCIRDELVRPAVSSKKLPDGRIVSMPIEDMAPYLPREEFFACMKIPPVKASLENE